MRDFGTGFDPFAGKMFDENFFLSPVFERWALGVGRWALGVGR
jgi:hypothetical protein